MTEPTDWAKTSFADATEAAIHHALVEHLVSIQARQIELGPFCDLSDIYKRTRRLVRALATGGEDPGEFLRGLE